jgi:hypothetical protein
MQFSGKILRGGRVIANNVNGAINEVTIGELRSWEGYIDLPAGNVLPAGEQYQLLTSDARRVNIQVLSGSYSSQMPVRVTFKASGPLV